MIINILSKFNHSMVTYKMHTHATINLKIPSLKSSLVHDIDDPILVSK